MIASSRARLTLVSLIAIALAALFRSISCLYTSNADLIERFESNKAELEQLAQLSLMDHVDAQGYCARGPGRQHLEEAVGHTEAIRLESAMTRADVKCVFALNGGIGILVSIQGIAAESSRKGYAKLPVPPPLSAVSLDELGSQSGTHRGDYLYLHISDDWYVYIRQ